ncbi:Ulp1 protease family C-terminal catalytic domain-containing protein [Phytophthora infestans]|uniref:Ulp1 protease family C-terminal catalytic domain-containing protein n=1 Tax=Phytophthora infestans TaxID=4787 RepID=A0A8S9TYM6_PHYIN|nr:Ulp1 protease family C-terminal catalytic domain-containing protein [Phytophthora infestans]
MNEIADSVIDLSDDSGPAKDMTCTQTSSQSELYAQPKTVRAIAVADEARSDRNDKPVDSETHQPQPVTWMIAPSKKRDGHAKAAKKARKETHRDNLKQTSRLVEAVADGVIPSMMKVLVAYRTAFCFKDRQALLGMTVLNQTRSTKIVVADKAKMPPTEPAKIRSILPQRRIESCQAQVAHFQNRWFSDHDVRMPALAISIKTGSIVYDVEMLKAMSSWHRAVQRFNDIRETIHWLRHVDLTDWNPEDCWRTGLLFPDDLEKRIANIDVLGDYFWITTLRGRSLVELSCLDLALNALKSMYDADNEIFCIPSYMMRFPSVDNQFIAESKVLVNLRDAVKRMNLWGETAPYTAVSGPEKPVWLFAVILYASDHWCATAVNFNELTITIFDPQLTGDRFETLRRYLRDELVPLLPLPPSPKRYRFKRVEWVTQVDDYNCGVFVIMFFEMLLLDVVPTGFDTSTALQYFRYRYISQIVSTM